MTPSAILTAERLASWSLRAGPGGYQADGLRALLHARKGVAEMPAGSGKTIVAARCVHALAIGSHRRFRVVWLANTIDQLLQGQKAVAVLPPDARARFDIDFQFAGEPITDPMTVDVLIVDECHHAAAATWAANILACKRAAYKIGLTATAHREDGLWPEVEKLIGPVVYTVSREVVESQGFTTGGRVAFLLANAEGEHEAEVEKLAITGPDSLFSRFWKKCAWQIKVKGADPATLREECERRATQLAVQKIAIADNEARNVMAADQCRELVEAGHSVLCLVYSVDQGRFIKERVAGSALVFSKMTVRDDGRRADIIQGFRDGAVRCLIATSLADEGLDVPRASALVLASGGRGISKATDRHGKKRHTARIEQRTARVLRAHDGKDFALIFDFYDWQHRFSKAASWTRFAGYKALGFTIDLPPAMRGGRKSTKEKVA